MFQEVVSPEEVVLARFKKEFLDQEVIIDPKTVGWYVVPIQTDTIVMTITHASIADKVPYRHYRAYGEQIELYVEGEVAGSHYAGGTRKFEFWTVRELSLISLVDEDRLEVSVT